MCDSIKNESENQINEAASIKNESEDQITENQVRDDCFIKTKKKKKKKEKERKNPPKCQQL